MKKHLQGYLLRFINQISVLKKQGQFKWNLKGEVIFSCCENHVEQEIVPWLPALLREVLQRLGKM